MQERVEKPLKPRPKHNGPHIQYPRLRQLRQFGSAIAFSSPHPSLCVTPYSHEEHLPGNTHTSISGGFRGGSMSSKEPLFWRTVWTNVTMYTTAYTGDTQKPHWSICISQLHSVRTERVYSASCNFLPFFSISWLLCSLCRTKQNYIFKFCEHLTASNAMTRFGSRSYNSCYFTPRHQKRSQKVWNKKKFPVGACPQTPLAGALHMLYFASSAMQV